MTWPSRKTVIAVLLLTLAAALLMCLYDAIQPGKSAAEKAYWQGWASIGVTPDSSFETAVPHFRQAFRLEPGERRYQLALTNALAGNPEALRRLANDKHLCGEALIMDEYFQAMPIRSYYDHPSGGYPASAETDALKVRLLQDVKRLDPNNATACYDLAGHYYFVGRRKEAAAEVADGNRRPYLRQYMYIDPRFARTIMGIACQSSRMFPALAQRRELARQETIYANILMRQRKTTEAIRVLDDNMVMARQVAAGEPRTNINYLVGTAISKISYRYLDAAYKDFGMRAKHDQLKRVDAAYEKGAQELRTWIDRDPWITWTLGTRNPTKAALGLAFQYVGAAPTASQVLLAVVLIWWFAVGLIARRRKEEPFTLTVWRPGQIVRLLFVINVLAIAISVGLTFAVAHYWETSGDKNVDLLQVATYAPMVGGMIAQIIIFAIGLFVIRRVYINDQGRIGWLRFLFKLPAAQHAWKDKHLAQLLAASLVMLVWLGGVITLVHRPAYGAYPWQVERLDIGGFERESSKVTEILAKLPR